MISELFSALFGVLCGLLLGHRLALGRDKRKEFNETVWPVQKSILKAIDSIEREEAWLPWGFDDLYAVKVILSAEENKELDGLVRRYYAASTAAQKPDGFGGSILISNRLPDVQEALEDIRDYIKPKLSITIA